MFFPLAQATEQNCDCALPNTNLTYDATLKPDLNYAMEWMYYNINLDIGGTGLSNSRLQMLFYRITPNYPYCIHDNNSSIYYLQYNLVSDLVPIHVANQTIYPVKNVVQNKLQIITPDNRWSIVRDTNTQTMNITIVDSDIHLIIHDNMKHFVLQGNNSIPNGFVANNPDYCSGSFAQSYMRNSVEGNIMGIPIKGIGYGEHILTSIQSKNIPKFNRDSSEASANGADTIGVTLRSKVGRGIGEHDCSPEDTTLRSKVGRGIGEHDCSPSGWNCHYLHLFDTTNSDYFLCHTQRKDNTRDPYDHGVVLYGNKHHQWLTVTDFETIPVTNWTSTKTGITYPYVWDVKINSKEFRLFIDNTYDKNLEKEYDIFGTHVWNSNIIVQDKLDNYKEIGVGVTEVYIFSNQNNV